MSSSSLDKLFKAWGLTFDMTKVVADMEHVAKLQDRAGPGRAGAERDSDQQRRRGHRQCRQFADGVRRRFFRHASGRPYQDGAAQNIEAFSGVVDGMTASYAAGQIAGQLPRAQRNIRWRSG